MSAFLDKRKPEVGALMFAKILIANRGEIACRVIKTARRLGIKTVAVYSDADRGARHVAMADEAVHIGGSPARESYLVADKILEAARRTGARGDPSGLRLPVGECRLRRGLRQGRAWSSSARRPPPSAPWAPRAKPRRSWRRPGCRWCRAITATTSRPSCWPRRPTRIGFPVLIKASAGGGGKGMRVVESAGEVRRRAGRRQARGQGLVRRRPCAGREVPDAAAPYRDPGLRRHATAAASTCSSATARSSAATRR